MLVGRARQRRRRSRSASAARVANCGDSDLDVLRRRRGCRRRTGCDPSRASPCRRGPAAPIAIRSSSVGTRAGLGRADLVLAGGEVARPRHQNAAAGPSPLPVGAVALDAVRVVDRLAARLRVRRAAARQRHERRADQRRGRDQRSRSRSAIAAHHAIAPFRERARSCRARPAPSRLRARAARRRAESRGRRPGSACRSPARRRARRGSRRSSASVDVEQRHAEDRRVAAHRLRAGRSRCVRGCR